MYDQCRERTLIVHSFGKFYELIGWRIGDIIGPEPVVQRMALLLQTVTSCVSSFIQLAAIEVMTGSQQYVDGIMEAYRRRRDIIVAGLNEIKGIKCLKPGGAFYVFPNISGSGCTSNQFSTIMLGKL